MIWFKNTSTYIISIQHIWKVVVLMEVVVKIFWKDYVGGLSLQS